MKGFFNERLNVETYKKYDHLTVKSIDTEGLLAMKLTSARDGSRDFEDSLTLMNHLKIKTMDELYKVIEKNKDPKQQ